MRGFRIIVISMIAFRGASSLAADDAVVARVNGEAVTAAEVLAELRLAKVAEPTGAASRDPRWRAALEQVIDQRLVLSYLSRTGDAASSKDIDLALAQFEKELKAQNITLDQHCERVGLTKADVRRSLAWKLSWKRYCDKQLTPTNLEKYFGRFPRDFDGTQLRVAQILFKLASDADEAAVAAAMERAGKLRREIISGTITFADAAKQFSDAPSGASGGDIGWIERHRPMPEDYSKIAFTLKQGDISEPFRSSFGVHVITVVDEKRGTRGWQEAETELRSAVTLYLFRWIADQQRQTAKIELVSEAD